MLSAFSPLVSQGSSFGGEVEVMPPLRTARRGGRLHGCQDCGGTVSESAKVCPHCGSTRPHPPSYGCAAILILSVMLLLLGKACSGLVDSPPAPSAGTAEWLEASGNIWIGTRLYIKTGHTYVCTVAETTDKHIFPDGTTREGVKVVFKDLTTGWIPREAVKLLYDVRSDELPK